MINTTGIIAGSLAFVSILGISYFIEEKKNRNKMSDLNKRLNREENEDFLEEFEKNKVSEKEEAKFFIDKLEQELEEAEIKMGIIPFCLIMFIATVILYFVSLSIFKKAFVALAPLPFTLYFVPRLIIDNKKQAVMKKFDKELIVVLRRMSSVLQSGSILQAVEEVKNLKQLSKKMKKMLYEIHHRIKFGDSIETAFYKAAKEYNSKSLEIAVVSIDLNKELGADLSSSLNEIAQRIQQKDLMLQEANSLMASTYMIGNVLSVAPFLILAYLGHANPTYFDDYLVSFSNQCTFMTMILVMFAGIYFVQKSTKAKIE